MNTILESPIDKVLQEDLEYIAHSKINLEKIENSTVLVTGATGLIGSQIVKTLICCNRIKNSNIKIIALIRDEMKANWIYKNIVGLDYIKIIKNDIVEKIEIEESIDYIIHTASITSSKYFVTNPVETIETIVTGTKNILDLAVRKNIKGMVYLSSMEVFGTTNINSEDIKEEDLGYIDILSVRSSYSEGKRMAETLCASYNHQYKLPVKIARLAQTFGAGVSYKESRIFGQIARCVIEGKDIVLRTKGESIGNYCYIRDAIRAILILVTAGKNGEAYIISNENSIISIKDMATMVSETIAKGKISVVLDISKDMLKQGYAPDTTMRLNPSKMKSLGWESEIDLEEAFRRMISSMEEQIKNDQCHCSCI